MAMPEFGKASDFCCAASIRRERLACRDTERLIG
jgi:hypothetical protein